MADQDNGEQGLAERGPDRRENGERRTHDVPYAGVERRRHVRRDPNSGRRATD